MERRDEMLDLVRGVSALFVLAGHARNFVMVDAADVVGTNLFTKLFYLVTSLHHQAVMVFFVLSGYFVGGSVLGALSREKFTWIDYLIARLSRLWMVLVPALLLTLVLDFIGGCLVPAAYKGSLYNLFVSGPSALQPAEHGVATLFANLAFLQTWLSPVYGTNGPLWSLAYEFWYYMLFPLVAFPLLARSVSPAFRVAALLLFAILCSVLPPAMLSSGVIWLMGVGVWKISRIDALGRLARGWWWRLAGGAIFAGAVLAAKLDRVPYGDFVVGAAFAIWMPSLLGPWRNGGWHRRTAFALSEISFSLYIIHFPLMFLMVAGLLKGTMYQPDFPGILWFSGLIIASVASTVVFWWCFESRTHFLRKFMKTAYRRLVTPTTAS